MICPFCGKARTKVIESRNANRGRTVRRRRVCLRCHRRFTTYERPGGSPTHVLKRDGSREIFSREKLRSGLLLACHKRPVSDHELERVMDRVERGLSRRYSGEVPSRVIGELVLKQLKRLDKVAYVRFASVYRSFSDVDQFIRESRAVKKK